MSAISFSPEQSVVISAPEMGSLFVEGPPGSGKTTAGAARLLHLIESGVPGDEILILVPQRTLAAPYFDILRRPGLPPGSPPDILTLGGLGQRMIELFWPAVAPAAGFRYPDHPPAFLTLETAQYYLARIVDPMVADGAFENIAIDRPRLYSQILDNLNKAAFVGFDHTTIAARLSQAYAGRTTSQRPYEDAQIAAGRFRAYCLENNLLDFSLQIEVFASCVWPAMIARQYLIQRYRHLIYDNIEEDVPVVHDILAEWLPQFDSSVLFFDQGGGYRSFLGADPVSAYRLKSLCESHLDMHGSYVITPELEEFRQVIDTCLSRHRPPSIAKRMTSAVFHYERYFPETVDWIASETSRLVHDWGVQPDDIVIIGPFMSDTLRFTLMNRLVEFHVPVRSHRPSRPLSDEPAAKALLALARLAHPQWNLKPSRAGIRYALVQSIADLDLVRADLLTRIAYNPNRVNEAFTSFDRIQPEMQERITYLIGERFEQLRLWLEEYRQLEPVDLDVFLSRLFGEVLSQPGFTFHEQYDAAAVAARLVESVQKFRQGTRTQGSGRSGQIPVVSGSGPLQTGRDYIDMVENGVLAAQYQFDWEEQEDHAVLVAPAHTYLMANRPTRFQFWLDVGSQGWWERLSQPLTHPHVLSRRWTPGAPWTDADEYRSNQETLQRLVSGLILRCRERIYLLATGIGENGDETRGPLLQAVQMILKYQPFALEVVESETQGGLSV